MDDYGTPTYDGDTVDDMWTGYDYHVNTGELTDWFPDDDTDATSDIILTRSQDIKVDVTIENA